MSRSAEIHRTTNETDVELSLDLDGAGAGSRDHRGRLLRPPARRGGAPWRPRPGRAGGGRPRDRRPPHGGGHRPGAGAGARRGARRPGGHPPLRARGDPDGRGARELRDRHLGTPVPRRSRAEYPDARVADFDTDLAEEFLRAVASTAKLTLHLRVEAGANSHHMVEASFKAFARALREAVADDPGRDRRAVHEGGPVSAAHRDPRLRHGQPPLRGQGAGARGRAAAS